MTFRNLFLDRFWVVSGDPFLWILAPFLKILGGFWSHFGATLGGSGAFLVHSGTIMAEACQEGPAGEAAQVLLDHLNKKGLVK